MRPPNSRQSHGHRAAVPASAAARPADGQPSARAWPVALLVLLVTLTMGLSGLLSVHTGVFQYADSLFRSGEGDRRAALVDAACRPTEGPVRDDSAFAMGAEAGVLAKVMSSEKVCVSGLSDLFVYYGRMPSSHAVILAVHTVMAGFCMLAGALQFWPAFRRRWPRVHRAIGVTYILTVTVAAVSAMAYMAVTPPDAIFVGLTGVIAEWSIAILILLTMALAMWHLRQRRIAQHQAFMALNFGLLMVQPLLRWDWAALHAFVPAVDLNTLTLATLMFLAPQGALIGYALLWFNRWSQRMRPQPAVLPMADAVRGLLQRGWPLMVAASVLGAGLMLWTQGFSPELTRAPSAVHVAPAAVLAHQAQALSGQDTGRLLLMLGAALTMLATPGFVRAGFAGVVQQASVALRGSAALMAAGLALVGAVQWHWGSVVGLPAGQVALAGGAHFATLGALSLGFAALLGGAALAGRASYIKEWGVFVALLAWAPLGMRGLLWLMAQLPLPAHWLASGQFYLLASAGPALVVVLLALTYVAHGQASRERFAV